MRFMNTPERAWLNEDIRQATEAAKQQPAAAPVAAAPVQGVPVHENNQFHTTHFAFKRDFDAYFCTFFKICMHFPSFELRLD